MKNKPPKDQEYPKYNTTVGMKLQCGAEYMEAEPFIDQRWDQNFGVRLSGGPSRCEGWVEVYYNKSWMRVVSESWSDKEATVVCRQLGCGSRTQSPNPSQYKRGNRTECLKGLQCSGSEEHLGNCSLQIQEFKCGDNIDAAVLCADQFALRLVNGTSVCDGRLEIFSNGSWGTVCDDSWDLPDANVVCRQLQCETAVNAITPVSYGPGTGHIWLDDVHCQGNESFLWKCTHRGWGQHDCRHKEDVGVNCTGFKILRLTNGCSGQLQVFYNNSWGSVCANKMDETTATVICRELGCGTLTSTIHEEESNLDPDPKWLDNVKCRGHEASIWQCPSSPWGKNACTRSEVANFSCSGVMKFNTNTPKPCSEDIAQEHCSEPTDLRLVGATNNCSGRVEIKYGDTWGTVCDDDWDLKDVQVVCRQLLCGEAVSAKLEFGGGSGVIWLNKVKCRGTEAHLWDCQHEPLGKNDCEHKEDAGVNCTGFTQDNKSSVPKEVSKITASKEQPFLVIVCIVLGAVLFLIFVILIGQVQTNRTLKKGMAMDELLPINNAVYEEIEYKLARQGTYGAPRKGSFLSDELPYDYEDIEDDDQDHVLGGKLASLEVGGPGYYDDTAIEKSEDLAENISNNELPYNYDDVEDPLENTEIDSHAAVDTVTNANTDANAHAHKALFMLASADNQDVRLMDGGRICEGRVEVFYNEEWGTVCDDGWDLNDAAVVCRQLGCGDALLAPPLASFGQGTGEIVLDDVSCTGDESALNMCASRQWGSSDCNHGEDAGVVCSGMILINGSSPCSGRLEVFHQSICEANFDQMAAEVVCRELKCGAPKQFGGGMFGQGSDSVLLRKVQCFGDENQIINCISPNSTANGCTRRNHVGIVCVPYRLVNGFNSCSGRVEFYYNRQWGTVCDRYWDLQDANVFCNQMGCGYAIKALGQARFGEGHGEIWTDNLQCEGNEADLTKCPALDYGQEECTHKNDAGVICSVQNFGVRLYGGPSRCEGWVEIYYNRTWVKVAAQSWSDRDASVVCRQLQCGSRTQTPNSSQYIKRNRTLCLKGFECLGNEKHLGNCSHPQENECRESIDAAVACTDHFALRLVDGRGICDGRLEIFHNGSWGTVCDDSWDIQDASVVCRQLQCNTAPNILASVSYGPGSGHIWLDEVHCQGNESSLQNCGHQTWGQHDCKHKEDVGVNCTEFKVLRLTNGCSGQLQVFYNNSWGSVCANGMDKTTTAMICQELGCGNLSSSITEESSKLDPDPKWLDNMKCRGHESSIWQCPSSPWGKNKCSMNEVAAFTCSGNNPVNTSHPKSCSEDFTQERCSEPQKLSLVGGTSNCSGRVELLFGDTWGTVCDDDWDLKDAQVVCRQLGCGEAVSAEMEFGGGNGVIWLNKVKCRGTETHLWYCQHDPLGRNDCEHKEDAGVNCRGFESDFKARVSKDVTIVKTSKEQSILVIVCIVLGAFLFLLLVLLVGQLQRNRMLKKGMAMDELLPIHNAVYEEIEYKLARQRTYDAPRKGSFLSDELPYDYEDIEEDDQDRVLAFSDMKVASLDDEIPGYYDDTAVEKTEDLSDSYAGMEYPLSPEYDDIEDEPVGE
ncbi:scavenger receptor cysteine-rich type 1 protein M130-like [Polypterus senegalus]|uniref:scavenger receptor cysteine-rich type 1 protein M130-like n=1 Tax=Polypterus senegalus TaxID=55291 RepID=UPI001964ACE9|nr:scavenger receptor cysteine-rich type 1 protein M130-like [Polypterus senegalus]